MPSSSKTPANSSQSAPFLPPSSGLTSPSGFAAPPLIQSNSPAQEQAALLQTASKVLNDPLLLRQLSDRVYELMLEDLRYQRERSRNYGSRS
ncbi:MAG: hypothetical protein AB1589_20625 [Cyanobacteriota bacterium]